MSGLQSSLQIPLPAFMAPEVLRGSEPGPKSDIFSLGMVLYETLTGHTCPSPATIATPCA